MKKILWFFWLLSFIFPCVFASLSDIQGHPYEAAIEKLVERNIVKGYEDGTFKPNKSISRAELLKVVMLAAKVDILETGYGCFSDVNPGEWYLNHICTAWAMGIVRGYEDGSFKPNAPVRIAEGLKIALETFKIKVPEGKEGEAWYAPYVNFASDKGILSKYRFSPEAEMSRWMMAYVTAQILEQGGSSRWSAKLARKSPGCGKSQPSSAPTSVEAGGVIRTIITSIGSNTSSSRPQKLIIGFHGRTSTNGGVQSYYGIDRASKGNAISVYPLWLPEEGPQRNWRTPGDKIGNLRDYALFDAIVEKIGNEYCVDLDQIYVVGHSLGGWFTSMLACARGDMIRGVGIAGGSPMQFPKCSWPTAAIIMHNPSDPLASFAGGQQIRNMILKQNSCWPETESYPAPSGSSCQRYTNCLSSIPVVWCETDTEHVTHGWPNQAAQTMMKFFEEL